MSASRYIAATLRIAHMDLQGAIGLAPLDNRNAVYLCAQSAEKIVRGILTSEGLEADRFHNLEAFIDMVPDENPLKPALRSVQELKPYLTTYRYATKGGSIPTAPTSAEVAEYIRRVKDILEQAAEAFGVDLGGEQPARRPGPLR